MCLFILNTCLGLNNSGLTPEHCCIIQCINTVNTGERQSKQACQAYIGVVSHPHVDTEDTEAAQLQPWILTPDIVIKINWSAYSFRILIMILAKSSSYSKFYNGAHALLLD